MLSVVGNKGKNLRNFLVKAPLSQQQANFIVLQKFFVFPPPSRVWKVFTGDEDKKDIKIRVRIEELFVLLLLLQLEIKYLDRQTICEIAL